MPQSAREEESHLCYLLLQDVFSLMHLKVPYAREIDHCWGHIWVVYLPSCKKGDFISSSAKNMF